MGRRLLIQPGGTLARVIAYPVPAWMAMLGAVAAAVAVVVALRRRPGRPAPSGGTWAETGLTLTAAAIATVMAGTGMWQVVADAVDLPVWLQAAVFAFLEVAILASAIRARRALQQTGSTGVDGAAVWVLAGLSAALSAVDARSGVEVLLRLAAPLVAAWLWERGMAPERRQANGRRSTTRSTTWRFSPARLLLRLRLTEAIGHGPDDVDRARRIARLTRVAWRHHTLAAAGAASWRQRRTAARLRRHTLAAVEHLHLGEDPAVRDLVRRSLATLYQVAAGTAPGALTDLTPWAPTTTSASPDMTGHAPAIPALAVREPVDQMVPPALAIPAPASEPGAVHFGQSEQARTPTAGLNGQRLNAVNTAAVRAAGEKADATEQQANGPGPSTGAQLVEQPTRQPEPANPRPHPAATAGKRLRARQAAEAYLARTGQRPTTRQLATLAGVSTGTAQAALTDLIASNQAAPTEPTTDDRSRRDHVTRKPPESTSTTPDKSSSTHLSDPTHVPQNKIQNDHTPRHHDPEEDQQRVPEPPRSR